MPETTTEHAAAAPAAAGPRQPGALSALLRRSPLMVFIVATVIVFGVLRPGFLSVTGFLDIGQQIAVTAIVAFGMTAVIIARGIDISVGSTLSVSGIAGALMFTHGLPAPLAIAATILVGALIGTLNGVLIGLCGVSPPSPPWAPWPSAAARRSPSPKPPPSRSTRWRCSCRAEATWGPSPPR